MRFFRFVADALGAGQHRTALVSCLLKIGLERSFAGGVVVSTQKLSVVADRLLFAANFTLFCHV